MVLYRYVGYSHVTHWELCRGKVRAIGVDEELHPEGKELLLGLV